MAGPLFPVAFDGRVSPSIFSHFWSGTAGCSRQLLQITELATPLLGHSERTCQQKGFDGIDNTATIEDCTFPLSQSIRTGRRFCI
jgi:hypothetical protein